MPRARTLWWIALAAGMAVVGVALGPTIGAVYEMWTTSRAATARLHAALSAHRDAFLEDQRFLASLPILAPRPALRDAGPLLDPRVRWKPAAAPSGPEALPDSTVDAIERRADWMHAGPDVWGGVDFAWMARLAGYDHWDVDRAPVPLDRDSWPYPVPDARDLAAWSKLRIAKGVHERALAPALAEVEDLARLCLTVERLQVQLAGLAILGQARKAAERGAPALLPRTIDRETGARMLRALSAAEGFARLDTPASYEGDFAEIVMGRCTALYAGLGKALLVHPYLRRARSPDYERLDRLLASSPGCRLARLRERWARRGAEGGEPAIWPDRFMMGLLGESILSLDTKAGGFFGPYEASAP